MNIAKHMEAIFVAALAFAGTASFAVEALPQAEAHSHAPIASNIGTVQHMPVVVISAKRMTAAEKLASQPTVQETTRSR